MLTDSRTRGLVAGALLLTITAAYVAFRRHPARRLDVPAHGDAATASHASMAARRVPASPTLRALVAPLTEGSRVGAWRVETLEGPPDGWLHLHLTRASATLRIVVARLEGSTVRPPVTEGSYGLFYFGGASLDREAQGVMREVAMRLRAHADLSTPTELRPFTPTLSR